MIDAFREKMGSIICRELLGMPSSVTESARPSQRTAAYYSTRPCSHIVAEAARIVEEMLLEDVSEQVR